jgi:hypothetical protein
MFSCLRPAMIVGVPFCTSLLASVLPMPDVAPMMRTFLYGKAMLGSVVELDMVHLHLIEKLKIYLSSMLLTSLPSLIMDG